MRDINYKSNFDKIIRIKDKQKQWIQDNKKKRNCKTDAGFLEVIINYYKQYGVSKPNKRP